MSPSLTRSRQPSCLSWAGATESIILLQLCCCGCLINDTTNNNCHAVTSVSSSRLAQPGAALCRLPPQIRTPLEKLFTHLSSPQAPLHFVCPPKDPMEDIITFFKVRNNCSMYIAPEVSDKTGPEFLVFSRYGCSEDCLKVFNFGAYGQEIASSFSLCKRHSSFGSCTPPWYHPHFQLKVSLEQGHSSPFPSVINMQSHTWLCGNKKD